MKNQTLEALIADGYTGKQLYKFENCLHYFEVCQVFKLNGETDEIEIRAICNKCGCDDHVALMLGIHPMYYERKENLV